MFASFIYNKFILNVNLQHYSHVENIKHVNWKNFDNKWHCSSNFKSMTLVKKI